MGKWLLATLFFMLIIHDNADARSRRVGRSTEPDENGIATTPAPAPAMAAPTQPPPQQAAPTDAPSPPPATGASQIFVWKEGNTLHAVNNLSDVPPRYSKRVESADKNPLMIRMVAAGVRPAVAKSAKKLRKGKSKRQTAQSKNPAAAGAPQNR